MIDEFKQAESNIAHANRFILNFINIFMIFLSAYIALCFIDNNTKEPSPKVLKVVVEEPYNNNVKSTVVIYDQKEVPDLKVVADPGDIIHIDFEVNRNSSSESLIERIFIDADGKQYVIFTVDRITTSDKFGKRIIDADYKIPLLAIPGCGKIYSKSTITKPWNFISVIKPNVELSPSVGVCVTNKKIKNLIFEEQASNYIK